MPIEVEGPDGKVHTFADGSLPQDIQRKMSEAYGGAGLLTPQGLPKPGDATAASGAVMPSMQSTPSYRTNEDDDNLLLGVLFPKSASLIQNTPGHAMRVAQAKKVGENLGNLEERQRGGTQVLDMLHQLGETADEGNQRGDLDAAIGPVNASPTLQRIKGAIGSKVYSPWERGYNLNNQLMHDIHGLTTAFISSAAKGGITMSDARQKAFEETMGAMMKATTKPEFDKIKKDAERIIMGTFGLAPGASVEPTRSSRVPAPVAVPSGGGQRYHNPQTGEIIEWDGKAWKKVN